MNLLAPLFLLGALGLLLPWLLHRFSRHNPERVPFPSSRFLEETTPPVARTRQLRHRLLFALRCLFLLGLCFLFAEPYLKTSALDEAENNITLVVDRSLSMQTTDRWSQAQQAALDFLDTMESDSAIELLSFDRELVEVVAMTSNINAIKTAIEKLEPGSAAADYGVTMQQLDALSAKRELATTVVLVTDAQISNLPSQLRQMTAGNIAVLNVLKIGSTEAVNASINAEAVTEDGATARISVVAALTTTGDTSETEERASKVLRVSHEERVLTEVSLSLSTAEHQTIFIDDLPLPAAANINLTLELLDEDDLLADNRQVIAVRQVQPVEIGMMSTNGSAGQGAEVYLTTAFETGGKAKVIREVAALESMGSGVSHAIVITNINTADLDTNGVNEFVKAGGNVLLVHAPSSIVASDTNESQRIGRVEYGHPLALGDFDWLSPRFYDLPELNVAEEFRTLLATTNESPILLERRGEGGRLLLLADPLDAVSSDLPLQPTFADLIQNVLSYFTSSSALPLRAEAGELISFPANVQLIDSSGNALLDLAQTNSAQDIRLDDTGIYTVLSKQQGEHKLEVVTPLAESDMRTLAESDVAEWEQNEGSNVIEIETTSGELTEAESKSSVKETLDTTLSSAKIELSYWLLPLLALLLIGESLFANLRLNVRRDGS